MLLPEVEADEAWEWEFARGVQVISLLGYLRFVRKEEGPHIVVAPLSVMNNWVTEIKRWCCQLRVVPFHGPQSERDRIKRDFLVLGSFDVVCTTYEMLVAGSCACAGAGGGGDRATEGGVLSSGLL